MTLLLVWMLFLHWFGDFVFQTRWMADNKSKNIEALTLHVFVYSLVLWIGVYVTTLYYINDLCRFVICNFLLHWTTDFWTSKMTKQAVEEKNTHKFFAIIGFDQFVHTSTLILTLQYLLGIS